MKKLIRNEIVKYVAEYADNRHITCKWGVPVVGFADANHEYIKGLKSHIGQSHATPEDSLEKASIIISYFVPFTRELAEANGADGRIASVEWARAYEETNAMFGELNRHIIKVLAEHGYKGTVSEAASRFSYETLMSDWSQRHIAYGAGLGTFGVNNMLITEKGCCGRYNSVITDLDVQADGPMEEELCIYKNSGGCGICVRNCPAGALSLKGWEYYDRQACYEICKENAEIYEDLGSSYSSNVGSEVCGKCITGSPCAFRDK